MAWLRSGLRRDHCRCRLGMYAIRGENAMDLNCGKCGRLYVNLPDQIKQPIYCGECKTDSEKRPKPAPEDNPCKHRGREIGKLDCRCGGKPNVYWCNLLDEPCVIHAIGKPWGTFPVLPEEGFTIGFEPMGCWKCPLRETTSDILSTSLAQFE